MQLGTTLCSEPLAQTTELSGTPTACVYTGEERQGQQSPAPNFPEDLRVSLPARSGSEILLLVLGAINTEAVQWEEMGNRNLRLSGGNLGFYGVSVPSVPLFTGG